MFACGSRITDNLTRLPAFNGRFVPEFGLPVSTIASFGALAIGGYGQLLSKANASACEKFQLLNIRPRLMLDPVRPGGRDEDLPCLCARYGRYLSILP